MIWDEDAQIRGVHPIVALRDFLLDEESALYPRTLIVGFIEEEEEDMPYEGDLDPEEGQIADSDLANIVAQLGDRLLPKVLEVTRVLRLDSSPHQTWTPSWTSHIVSGDLEAVACLLITLLPNLEKLRIVDRCRYSESPPFYWTLNCLLDGAMNSECNLTGLNSFKKLSEVGLHGSGDGSGVDFLVGTDFSALPSIRTIKGRNVDGEDELSGSFYKTPPFPHTIRPYSDITTLEFHQSSIDMNSFFHFIRRIKSLRNFTYDFSAATTVGEQTWEPRGIVLLLLSFASRSLVHLELTGVTDIYSVKFRRGEPFIGSLRAFEVLETLRLETVMLYKEVEGTVDTTPDEMAVVMLGWVQGSSIPRTSEDDWAGGRNALVEPERLVDILPASAKRLRLVGGLSNEEADAMLEDLVEMKDERIPNLRSIFFEDVDSCTELSSVCEKASVKAKFCARV